MKNTKKLLALLLALVMCVGLLAGCGGNKNPSSSNSPDPSASQSEPATDATYTYNYALSVFPTLWNYFTYETSTDAEILDYITDGFWSFDYNETEDGYVLAPSMAAGDPVDVTDQYIGQYGLEEGATNRAYIVSLRDDLKWEDGTVINATSFVESLKRLLDPQAQNYRADSVYSGSFVIHGASNYLKQGQYAYSNMVSADYGDDEYVAIADMTTNESGAYYVEGKGDVWFNIDDGGNWGSNSLSEYVEYGYIANNLDKWENLVAAADASGYVALTADLVNDLCDVMAELHGYADAAAYAADAGDYAYREWEELGFYGMDMPEYSFDEVGVKVLSDTELLVVIDKSLEGFYLKYSMFMPLVHLDLYDSLAKYEDGVYTNTYGTSAETTMSYGPYKLSAFQADKQYTLERNDNWHGITEDTYQTTHIVVDYVPEASTRLELFLQGKLDSYGLQKDDMDEYSKSDYTYYTPGDSIYAIALNPNFSALETNQANAGANINKTILTLPSFRQALSLSLNRADFCLATSPTNGPAFALYSDLIISDPEGGVAYRSTDVAKKAMAEFWGVSEDYGDGKLYADIDEAIDSITGYNLTKAKQLFDQAYDEAIAQGLMDEDDVVEIKIGTPNSTSAFYNNGYEFLVNNYTEAVVGTKLEGKLTFSRDDTLGNGFADALKNNQVDMLFGVGWTGSALDPYGLMEVFVSPSYQYDQSFDYSAIDLVINVKGVDYTTSVQNWFYIMNGTPITITSVDGSTTLENYSCGSADNDPETRLNILGTLEGAILNNFNFIPVMDASTASLKGQQYNYYNETYIYGVGRGGVKYMTYNYTDAEWDAYVASCGGTLSYK